MVLNLLPVRLFVPGLFARSRPLRDELCVSFCCFFGVWAEYVPAGALH